MQIPQIKRTIRISLTTLCWIFLAAPLSMANTKFDSYKGLVMTGYQGWFNTPDDGANRGWAHYGRNGQFEPGNVTIDFWPDMSEYKVTYPTGFKFADGSTARIFSSYDPSTIDLHFKWMKDYGIDGAFMQIFIHALDKSSVNNHYARVFNSAMDAAIKYDRAISIRYDLSGMQPGDEKLLLANLDQHISKYALKDRSKSPNFLFHKGKPLIALGGVGWEEDKSGTSDVGYLEAGKLIIKELRERGFNIMLRVPAQWRMLSGTQVVQSAARQKILQDLIKTVDIVMPWHVGAFKEDSYLAGKWPLKIQEDMEWCKNNGLDYVPVVYPGFSRYNLKGGEDGSFQRRNKGEFFRMLANSAIEVGAEMLFVAQFDEMDEGTQIFKCVNQVPVGKSPFVPYEEGLGSDHYLKITGEAREALRGSLNPTRIGISREPTRNSRGALGGGVIRIENLNAGKGETSRFQWVYSQRNLYNITGRQIGIGTEAGNRLIEMPGH